jgi:hypothetical protein
MVSQLSVFPKQTNHRGRRTLLKTAGCAAFALQMTALSPVFAPGVSAETIQGGVSQSVAIDPVKPGLRMGDTFDKSALPQFHTTKSWYRIPPWYAGRWHRDTMIYEFPGNPPIVSASRRDRWRGYQYDRLGHIWHERNEPFLLVVESDTSIEMNVIILEQPILVDENQVVIRLKGQSVTVDKATRAVVGANQKLETHDFRLAAPGRTYVTITYEHFDQDGRPLQKAPLKAEYYEQLTANFVPIYKDYQEDYYASFCNFLQSTGQADLIAPPPAQSQGQAQPVLSGAGNAAQGVNYNSTSYPGAGSMPVVPAPQQVAPGGH